MRYKSSGVETLVTFLGQQSWLRSWHLYWGKTAQRWNYQRINPEEILSSRIINKIYLFKSFISWKLQVEGRNLNICVYVFFPLMKWCHSLCPFFLGSVSSSLRKSIYQGISRRELPAFIHRTIIKISLKYNRNIWYSLMYYISKLFDISLLFHSLQF